MHHKHCWMFLKSQSVESFHAFGIVLIMIDYNRISTGRNFDCESNGIIVQ